MKWSKLLLLLCCGAGIALCLGCDHPETGTTHSAETQKMVYEGMPGVDLKNVLGAPDSTAEWGSVYDVEAGRKKAVERWYYPKRTVVLIDDTVKVPNENTPIN